MLNLLRDNRQFIGKRMPFSSPHMGLYMRMAMQNGSCKLLTTGQAAQRLGLSLSTLSKWRLTGEGPTFLKLGASVRYDQEALDAFAAKCVRRSTSEAREAV